jgi:hypothetical protein
MSLFPLVGLLPFDSIDKAVNAVICNDEEFILTVLVGPIIPSNPTSGGIFLSS